jgi:hypothetical protein
MKPISNWFVKNLPIGRAARSCSCPKRRRRLFKWSCIFPALVPFTRRGSRGIFRTSTSLLKVDERSYSLSTRELLNEEGDRSRSTGQTPAVLIETMSYSDPRTSAGRSTTLRHAPTSTPTNCPLRAVNRQGHPQLARQISETRQIGRGCGCGKPDGGGRRRWVQVRRQCSWVQVKPRSGSAQEIGFPSRQKCER